MGNTPIYSLLFLEPYQTDYALDGDETRFRTVENELYALYALFGNGVIDDDPLNPSWRIQVNPADTSGGSVLVTPGHGHLYYQSAVTTVSATVALSVPVGAGSLTTFWIYARPNATTPSQMTCDFIASLVVINQPDVYIGLGAVTVDTTTTPPTVTCYNDAAHGRVNISLFDSLAAIINKHVHIGGANNPSPINLATNVQGKLSGDYIVDLDASAISAGVVPAESLPLIDHNTLTHRGTLTHSEIESLLAALIDPTGYRLSDLEVANQLILALSLFKQAEFHGSNPSLAKALINTFLYVPGYTDTKYEASPSDIALATIDHTGHQVIGSVATGINSDTIVFTTAAQFSAAQSLSNILVTNFSGGEFTLSTPLNYRPVFDADFTHWQSGLVITDAPDKGVPTSDHFEDDHLTATRFLFVEFANLKTAYQAASEDWSGAQHIGIGFGLSNVSIPGNVYAFLILGSGGSSVAMSLSNNAGPSTISIGNPVEIYDYTASPATGQYVQKNLAEFVTTASQLTDVVGMGFYWKTDSNDANSWNARDVDFSLAVPTSGQISTADGGSSLVNNQRATLPDTTSCVFIWNESLYAPSGQLVLRIPSASSSTYWNLVNYSSSTIPSGSRLLVQTREANSTGALASAPLYTVPSDTYLVDGASHQGQYLEIVVTLFADQTLTLAPVVDAIILSLSAAASSTSKTYNSELDWETNAYQPDIVNIDTTSYPGDVVIADTTQIGKFLFARNSQILSAYQLTGDPTAAFIDATHLYHTPSQVWSGGAASGFDTPNDFQRLSSGNLLIADTGGDRVVEINASGALVRAIQGNLRLRTITRDLVALTATYNPRLGVMWIAFSQNVTISDKTQITVTDNSGANQVNCGATGINVILDNPINSKSPTIKIVFDAISLAKINSWTSAMKVLINGTAVASAGSSTDGTTGPVTGGGTGAGAGGTGSGNKCDGSHLSAAYALLARSRSGIAGTFTCNTGLSATAPASTIAGDFNGDGVVSSTPLLGPGGQSSSVTLSVIVGEIIFDNLYSPVSAQPGALDQWIVATSGADCVQAYDNLSNKLWNIPTSLAYIPQGYGGSAALMNNANIAIAMPIQDSTAGLGYLAIVNRVGSNVVIARLSFVGDCVRVIPADDSQSYYVLVDDVQNDGKNSRVDQVNIEGDVLWTWGSGLLSHPLGMRLLPNGDMLVSE